MKTNDGCTALHIAAAYSTHEIVRLLCERGAIVDVRDNDGCTPLWHAAWFCAKQRDLSCCNDDWYILRMLIDAGANINARSDLNRTPLLVMLGNNDESDLAVLGKLVQAGAETSARDNEGLDILRLCFTKPSAKTVITTIGTALSFVDSTSGRVYAQLKSICQESKDVRRREMVLIDRSAKDGGEALRLTLALGADIDIKRDAGGTAIHSAARWGNCDAISRLFAAGGSLECFDYNGFTPLAIAVHSNRTAAVRALIHHGSDPRAKGTGDDAQTAIEIATRKRNRMILGLLK
jgi:ankyrin repeat protein